MFALTGLESIVEFQSPPRTTYSDLNAFNWALINSKKNWSLSLDPLYYLLLCYMYSFILICNSRMFPLSSWKESIKDNFVEVKMATPLLLVFALWYICILSQEFFFFLTSLTLATCILLLSLVSSRLLALCRWRRGASDYGCSMRSRLPLSYWSPEESDTTPSRTATYFF